MPQRLVPRSKKSIALYCATVAPELSTKSTFAFAPESTCNRLIGAVVPMPTFPAVYEMLAPPAEGCVHGAAANRANGAALIDWRGDRTVRELQVESLHTSTCSQRAWPPNA